jgi:nucleotide-binding universal stress UspA family protein
VESAKIARNLYLPDCAAQLADLCEEIREQHPRTNTRFHIGNLHREIVIAARDLKIDLIVISTHNYHWYTHLLNGSDAEKILRHAPCPILITH